MPLDETISFSSEDPGMAAAISTARRSIGKFFEAFAHPAKNQRAFLVKVVFTEGSHQEHIWLADLVFTREKTCGVIGNEPDLPSLKFMQSVEFDPSQITDWMYIEDGYLVGGYTIRLIRELMSREERSAYDARAPYNFRESD